MHAKECIERGVTLSQATEIFREAYIRAALQIANGNQCKAASMLKVHRNTVNRACDSMGIDPKRYSQKPAKGDSNER